MTLRIILPIALLFSACTLLPVSDDSAILEGTGSAIGQIQLTSSSVSSTPSQSSAASLPSAPSSILTVGDVNAPLTLLLFTHHSCAYCKTFNEQLMPHLVADYIRSRELKVQIVPIILSKYAESIDQAKLLICANQQGKGIETHGALFRAPVATVRTQIELGLDQTALNTCLAAEETTQLLEAQALFATSMDAELVPTYFINESRYQGLPEWADLRGQIEQEL